MLFVIHGTNTHKVADQTTKLVATLLKKKPDAQVFYFEGGELEESEVDALTSAQGIFVEKHIVVLKQTLADSGAKDFILSRLEHFSTSANIVIISENKLLAPEKKKLGKYAEKIEEHEEVKKSDKPVFNVFALGDALGARDKRKLWILYTQALRSGLEVESVHGTLHWAVRGILAAQNARSPESAGQKEFMYSKYKRFLTNYSEGEIEQMSRDLINIYHSARRGQGEVKVELERWILGV